MAESASTGNSGTTGTTGTSSTSTSTSNGGAAPGSQSSSNGSFSTGKGNDGNGKGNNSGNFRGGLPGLNGESWSSYTNSKGSETDAAHSSGVEGPGLQNGNFGSKWGGGGKHHVSEVDGKHTIHPDANGKHSVKTDGGDGKGNYTVGSQQYMTVDEVYGKGNQSIVESQGDYAASSNEKSNVETSTFGKQDEISVTPLSVTEDKGLVNNDAIQSVEGLNFQQKDKANQEVMEAKKSRDDAESEDNANGMRNQLKAVAEKDAEAEDNNAFQVGDRDEEVANAKAEVDRLADEKAKYEKEQESNARRLKSFETEVALMKQEIEREDADYQAKLANNEQLDAIGQKMQELSNRYQEVANRDSNVFNRLGIQRDLSKLSEEVRAFGEQLGVDADIGGLNAYQGKKAAEAFQSWKENFAQEYFDGLKDFSPDSITAYKAEVEEGHSQRLAQYKGDADRLAEGARMLEDRQAELQSLIADNQKKSAAAQESYDSLVNNTYVGEEVTTEAKAEEAPTTEAPSYKGIIDAARDEINNSKDLTDEQKAGADTVLGNVETAAEAAEKASSDLAANPNDANIIATWQEATKTLNEALEDAKGDKTLKNTDFNKTFTEAVVAAINKSKVTMPDGSTKNIAEFMAETVTRSPELAKGLYEAKADRQERDGHKVLAAINRTKAKMVMTWLGSKFTFADNQIRSQFNQLAKTNMRATYATYNNVRNDETGKYSEADKAEAFDAIQQANSLMTASAALQASTGFFSGIGDGTSDGTYGVTNPDDLNGHQKALNAASNFAKIVLGLGVTPGANEAYQNMYYMAGAKVNQSNLFSKDFDGDGFALCQEYGNNAAVGMIAGAGELATGVALMFNPATSKMGINLAIDAVQTFLDGLYGVQKEVNKSIKYSSEVLNYFNEAKNIAAETGNKEAIGTMDSAIKQIEDFQLKSDEVGNLDNWLEGSGSNTADNGKFNQALSYDEWLKLIEADPVMQEYAKSLNR